jgi:hypothetical protein
MRAIDVTETYIDDTVRFLPSRQRHDIAAELRTLLNDELQVRAEESGHPPDEALALSLVRAFGRPNEVAARYQPVWTIIDPADSWSFTKAAIIGAGALILLRALAMVRRSASITADDFVKIGILAWLGALVVIFGAKSWIWRRWPAATAWRPSDHDRVSRAATAALLPIAMFIFILYSAPAWVLDQISRGRLDTSWAAYTAEFQRARLPFFSDRWSA